MKDYTDAIVLLNRLLMDGGDANTLRAVMSRVLETIRVETCTPFEKFYQVPKAVHEAALCDITSAGF